MFKRKVIKLQIFVILSLIKTKCIVTNVQDLSRWKENRVVKELIEWHRARGRDKKALTDWIWRVQNADCDRWFLICFSGLLAILNPALWFHSIGFINQSFCVIKFGLANVNYWQEIGCQEERKVRVFISMIPPPQPHPAHCRLSVVATV